jgi:pimeloyl-ACP methyl ester carboxylesterase
MAAIGSSSGRVIQASGSVPLSVIQSRPAKDHAKHDGWSQSMRSFGSSVAVLLATVIPQFVSHAGDDPPKPAPDPDYIRKMIPATISGTYHVGRLVVLRVRDRNAYIIEPTGKVDPQKRWVWIFPFWLGVNDGHGRLHHQFYVEKYLAAGFHVAGIDVGTSCGSPAAAEVCDKFYRQLTARHDLARRARLEVQSNGGLIGYAWAFRHPDCVDRIGGICPVTDFRTWPPPDFSSILTAPEEGLGYNMTLEELTAHQAELNPIENLEPLAKAGVKILHIHGDKDELVPMRANSTELASRFRAFGASAEVVVIPGLGHGGKVLYESRPLLNFLLAD